MQCMALGAEQHSAALYIVVTSMHRLVSKEYKGLVRFYLKHLPPALSANCIILQVKLKYKCKKLNDLCRLIYQLYNGGGAPRYNE